MPRTRLRKRREVNWPLACEPYFRRLRGSEGLLQAIAEEPWDDGLRLILADWLEDHGQPARAKFIRLQIKRQALPDWHPQKLVLEKQEECLFGENREEWLAGLPEVEGTYRICVYRFSAGLLERLSLCAEMVLRQAEALFSAVDVRHLQVDGLSDPAAFFALPLLARLSSLNLYPNKIGDEGARALAGSPYLAALFSLNLCENEIGDEGARALAGSPHLAALSSLDLFNNRIEDETVKQVLRARWPAVDLDEEY